MQQLPQIMSQEEMESLLSIISELNIDFIFLKMQMS